MCHASCVICHMSQDTWRRRKNTKWWSHLVKGVIWMGLPRLVHLKRTSVSHEVGSYRHLANPGALCLLKLSTVDSMRLKYAESGPYIQFFLPFRINKVIKRESNRRRKKRLKWPEFNKSLSELVVSYLNEGSYWLVQSININILEAHISQSNRHTKKVFQVCLMTQVSINWVGLTKPLTISLKPTSKHSSHLRKPSKGGR